MAWSANLKSVTKAAGIATVTLEFTNGKDTFEKQYKIGSPGDDFIGKQAAQEIRNLESLDTWMDSLTLGPVTIPSQEKTADEIAAAEFFAKRAKLRNLQDAISAGLSKDDPTPLEAEVKDMFQPEYIQDFRWSR